jgi:hypothetical protein
MSSVQSVDLTLGIARVPLFKGTYKGTSVWFVRMDVSDEGLARDLGLNFAPRLAKADTGCPGCIQTVKSSDPILGNAPVEFAGTVDFSPTRVLTPGPTGFPPLMAQPGSVAGPGYTDLVRVEGSDVVYNAPIVAVGDGPFDVTEHTNTLDRVMAIDTQAMTVDLQFIRAFSHGKDIFYFTFGGSGALSATLERGTFVPVQSNLPFANDDQNPNGARSAIFTFTNGMRGETSPPAQGLMHVILDNPPGRSTSRTPRCSNRCAWAGTRTTCSARSPRSATSACASCTRRCGICTSPSGARMPLPGAERRAAGRQSDPPVGGAEDRDEPRRRAAQFGELRGQLPGVRLRQRAADRGSGPATGHPIRVCDALNSGRPMMVDLPASSLPSASRVKSLPAPGYIPYRRAGLAGAQRKGFPKECPPCDLSAPYPPAVVPLPDSRSGALGRRRRARPVSPDRQW